jgi:Bacterial EndoU nuclease
LNEISGLGPLRLACDNKIKDVARFGNKYLKPDYEHILGIDFFCVHEAIVQVKGFHHDLMYTIEKSCVIPFANKKMFKHGFYTVDLIIDGKKFPKSMFPAEWTREKVISKLYEVYENYIKGGNIPELGSHGKYVMRSFIEEGVEIEMYISQKAKILTAYPILK